MMWFVRKYSEALWAMVFALIAIFSLRKSAWRERNDHPMNRTVAITCGRPMCNTNSGCICGSPVVAAWGDVAMKPGNQ